MRLATAEDIQRLDARAEKEFGFSRLVLMENAGHSVVLAMERVFGPLAGKRVTVFCGKGGNGGDGMVAARHLVAHGASIVVGLVGSRDELSGETRVNWTILDRMGLTPHEIKGEGEQGWVHAAVGAADIVVDALVGVGAKLPLTGAMAQVIQAVNHAGKQVVAVDLPSGVDPDTGAAAGPAIRAALTVTLCLPKRGLVLYPGNLFVGKLVTADLTFPSALLGDPAILADIVLPEEAAALIPARSPTAHKHEVGRVLVIAGSRAMPGAASLAAGGALAAGAGIVYVATAASAVGLLPARQPEWLVRPLADTPGGGVSEAALDELLGFAKTAQAVAVGPGMALEETTRRLIAKLIEQVEAPLVVDADALTALAAHPEVLTHAKGPRILTPHAGEMARLLRIDAAAVEQDRMGSARRAAADLKAIVVLKGARTIVADPGGRLFVIPTGNAGMATAGSGDVLTGVIAALTAQRLAPLAAAVLGAYVHGQAGDLVRETRTELAVTASGIIAHLGTAFHRLKFPSESGPRSPSDPAS